MAQIIPMPFNKEAVDRIRLASEALPVSPAMERAVTTTMSLVDDASARLAQLQVCLDVFDAVASGSLDSASQTLLRERARLLRDELKEAASKLQAGRHALAMHYSQINTGSA
jgi:uncharacterized protein (DUF2141 family)